MLEGAGCSKGRLGKNSEMPPGILRRSQRQQSAVGT